MSKGIVNRRDRFVWDNTHKPDISDVVSEIDDEMDDLLEDHDDKIVDIVGDNMNTLLSNHDDKVVDIVGDNMSTLLSSNAAAIRLIIGDKSGITSTAVKVGTWDATRDIYAKRITFENLASIESGQYTDMTVSQPNAGVIACQGVTFVPSVGQFYAVDTFLSVGGTANSVYSGLNAIYYRYGTSMVGGTTTAIVYFLVSTATS